MCKLLLHVSSHLLALELSPAVTLQRGSADNFVLTASSKVICSGHPMHCSIIFFFINSPLWTSRKTQQHPVIIERHCCVYSCGKETIGKTPQTSVVFVGRLKSLKTKTQLKDSAASKNAEVSTFKADAACGAASNWRYLPPQWLLGNR